VTTSEPELVSELEMMRASTKEHSWESMSEHGLVIELAMMRASTTANLLVLS
jgi:hypothetical protein